MVIFYKKLKKHNEIQLTKKQNVLKYSKNDKSSTIPSMCASKIKINRSSHIIYFKKA